MQNLIKCRSLKPSKGYQIDQNLMPSKVVVLLILWSIFMNATISSAQTLTVTPSKPKKGDVISFTYNPKGGKFENDTLKTVIVMLDDGFDRENRSVELIKDGAIYRSKFTVDSATLFVAFAFSSKKIRDSAPKDGHLYPIYEAEKPVGGALTAMADFYISKNMKVIYGAEPNYQKAADLFKQEMELYPSGRHKIAALQKYYQIIYKISPEKGKAEILAYIKSIDEQKQIADTEYYKQYRLYEILEMKPEMEKTLELITTKFPNSPIIFSRRYKDVLTPQAANEMEALANKLIIDYNMIEGKEFSSSVMGVYRSLGQAFLKEVNLPKFYFYLAKLNNPASKLFDLMNAATFLAETKKELAEAEKISNLGLQLIDSLIASKASSLSSQRLKEKKTELTGLLGRIYYEQGEFNKAYIALKNAHQENTEKIAFINTYYGLVLVKQKEYEMAKPFLQEAIRTGIVDDAVFTAFKETYLSANGKLADYTADLVGLKKEAAANKKAELQKIALNTPAPNFTLLDNKGKKVSLTDYKGKVVVLDFWATWCIPCLEAFPGMKKLSKKYENDKDVVFLFINTSETFTKDLSKNINSYLKKNEYSFHVLLDEKGVMDGVQKYKAYALYNVSAIPLKVVIDKTGNIRFRSTGYLGSDEKVVEELSSFIEAAKL